MNGSLPSPRRPPRHSKYVIYAAPSHPSQRTALTNNNHQQNDVATREAELVAAKEELDGERQDLAKAEQEYEDEQALLEPLQRELEELQRRTNVDDDVYDHELQEANAAQQAAKAELDHARKKLAKQEGKMHKLQQVMDAHDKKQEVRIGFAAAVHAIPR